MAQSLVSCEWLNEKIQSKSLGNIVILDVSWASGNKPDFDKDYKVKHIPGARYLNVLDATHTDKLVRNLPTPEHLTKLAQDAGVNTDSHVVIYSNISSTNKAGYFMSGRGWWTFRVYGHNNVSILDGGLEKWEKLGYKTTSDIPKITKGNFVASKTKHMYKGYKDVEENTKTNEFQVVDSRDDAQFNANHIPGAKQLFMGNLIDQSNCTLKSDDQLKEEFSKAGVDLSKPIVAHCNGGMSSSTLAFVAEKLGQKNVAVFHGGMTEWKIEQNIK